VDWAAEGFAKISERQFGDHKYSERMMSPSTLTRGRRALVGPMTMGRVGV
jgi:hypothetical protein